MAGWVPRAPVLAGRERWWSVLGRDVPDGAGRAHMGVQRLRGKIQAPHVLVSGTGYMLNVGETFIVWS